MYPDHHRDGHNSPTIPELFREVARETVVGVDGCGSVPH